MPAAKLTKALQKRSEQALDAFHNYYIGVWGEERWQNSLFPALCAPTRYCALINQYATTSETLAILRQPEAEGCQMFELRLSTGPGLISDSKIRPLLALTNSTDDTFPPPTPVTCKAPELRLLSHWNMDAASILAACVLRVEPGHRVLDLCAAPGGKSMALAQMLWPELHTTKLSTEQFASGEVQSMLHSNELDKTRNLRLESNLKSYLPKTLFTDSLVKVLRIDGSEKSAVSDLPLGESGYDRVLVDAPCSSERHVIHAHLKASAGRQIAEELANWKPSHSKTLARTQVSLLMTAVRAVKVGGSVLYATCSISHEENDGVIDRVLEAAKRERKKASGGTSAWKVGVDTDIEDLQTRALLDSMTESTKHGRIALPDHAAGGKWGPLYMCALRKIPHKDKSGLQEMPES